MGQELLTGGGSLGDGQWRVFPGLKLGIRCLMGPLMTRRFVPLKDHSWILAAFFVLALCPNTAQAHLVTSGAGPFFDGVAHFFVSLDDLLVVGLLLSFSPKLPTWMIVLVAGMIGLAHGSWNGAAMRATDTSSIASFGIVAAAGVVALLLSATAASVQQSWQRIALRVIGSWVAAFGLLAIAWHFRPKA